MSAARRLTWMLRHAPAGLAMDEAGFVEVAAVLAALDLSAAELDAIVARDGKQRFERRGARIRAAQGHSSDNGAVTAAALEASWTPWTGESTLWHGTNVEAALRIAREGLLPMRRTHVHLALARDSRVGKRAGVAVLLGVSPALLRELGQPVWLSSNGVALVRAVPAACVVAVAPLSRSAREVDWTAHFLGLGRP